MSTELLVSDARWYAVHTKPREEDRVDRNLQAWRVETFNPLIKKYPRGRAKGKAAVGQAPLFPRYIFARFDASKLLHKITYTRGVNSVVSFNNSPIPIENDIIESIQARVESDGCVRMDEEFHAGDEISIEDGLFKGLKGVFDRYIKDTDRVAIFLTNINYQASMEIDRSFIQKKGSAAHSC